uniref:Uncharacterized protein n=1 Tax=Acrobeloides nanus TaxID=290746 RepID=A0A914E1J7_9BILA
MSTSWESVIVKNSFASIVLDEEYEPLTKDQLKKIEDIGNYGLPIVYAISSGMSNSWCPMVRDDNVFKMFAKIVAVPKNMVSSRSCRKASKAYVRSAFEDTDLVPYRLEGMSTYDTWESVIVKSFYSIG